jgi:hypothetical protein
LSPRILIDAQHGIDLLRIGRLRCHLHLKLQHLLLKVGGSLHPLLKLGILHLHLVLKVYNPMGMGLHLLTGDVPSMIDVTKATVNLQ